MQFIQNYLVEIESRNAKEISWSTVRYMVSEIHYGGRITDTWDRVLMSAYTEKYFFQVASPKIFYCDGYILFWSLRLEELWSNEEDSRGAITT